MPGLIRLVLIGDVHYSWDPSHDAGALAFLRPDAAIFVGDFGEEAVDIVASIAKTDVPKAVILGNHDAWGPLYIEHGYVGVERQLDLLGPAHVGYGSKHFTAASGQAFSVVGARPFSDGNDTVSRCVSKFYDIHSMPESSRRITAELARQPAGEPAVVVGHNGPRGLGQRRHDPCGKDFRPKEGDFGDADLRTALDAAADRGQHVPLVTFGHMHHRLMSRYGKGDRNMAQIDANTGTVYLNCAVVPREMSLPTLGGKASQFTVVTLEEGVVAAADSVWVRRSDGEGGEFKVWRTHPVLSSERSADGRLLRKVYQAFDSTWTKAVPLPSSIGTIQAGDTTAEL